MMAYETHEIKCYSCDIMFRSREERTRHNIDFHQRFNSTDNISVKEYTGQRKKINDNPLICVQHQCVIDKDGCKGSSDCGHFKKDIYCDVDVSDFEDVILEFGNDSDTLRRLIIKKLNMLESNIKDFEVLEIDDNMAKVRLSVDISKKNLNCYMRLNDFKKMIREKNVIEYCGKSYYMEENRTVDIEGLVVTVKIF